MKKRNKKKNKIVLLVIMILGISVGYALLSTTLNITGIAGIKKNTWDIHWDDTSIKESGNVEASTPAYVEDEDKKIISFETQLELPGDFYEFSVDAKNYGTVDGIIDDIRIKFFKADKTEEYESLPEYINYSFTHLDGSKIEKGELIASGESSSYKFRLEFDENTETLPEFDEENPVIIIPQIEIDYGQDDSLKGLYRIKFNANGGEVSEAIRTIDKGSVIGTLPTATKMDYGFKGWYTLPVDGEKITSKTIPTGNVTYYAHWTNSIATFDTGTSVNMKMKKLAENTLDETTPEYTTDENVTSIVRSTIAPDISTMTSDNIISSPNSTPIYAWFNNGTIYYYSEAEDLYLNEDASGMFNNYKNITDIDMSFDSSNTINMSNMFRGIGISNLNLSNLDTSKVNNMSGMFAANSVETLDLRNFDTSNVTNMSEMFAGSFTKNINFGNWNTSKVTTLKGMFSGARVLSVDLSSFDTSNVTNFENLFAGTSQIKSIDISGWDFSNIDSLYYFFGMGLTNLEYVNLKDVNTSTITNMSKLFDYDSSLKTIEINNFDTSKVTNMSEMFYGCSSLTDIDVSNFDTRNVTNMYGMFYGCSGLTKLDLSNFNTSKVTSFNSMVGNLSNLEELNMSNFDFSNYSSTSLFMTISNGGFTKLKKLTLDNIITPTDCTYMLGGLTSIEKLSLKNADTSNATDMTAMFNNDNKIETLDLTNFDTSNVTNMGSMFYEMTSLTTIIVSDSFVVDRVQNSSNMFYNDTNLVGGRGTIWDVRHTDKEYAHYDYGDVNPGYFNAADLVSHTITFDANGGNVSETTRSVYEGMEIGTLPTPTKTNCIFEGWHLNNVSGQVITDEYKIKDDITLVAKWKNIYTVTFNPNGGNVIETSRTNYEGNRVGALPVPTRSGYGFDGWYIDITSGPKINAAYTPTNSITLKAKWTEIEAKFDVGKTVNIKFKALAGDDVSSSNAWSNPNTNITKIEKTTTAPDISTMTDANIVSTSDSSVPIYAWFDNGTIYYYSRANQVFLNEDPSHMFRSFDKVESIDTSFNTSLATTFAYLFYGCKSLESIDASAWSTSNVTNLYFMFNMCSSLTNLDLSSFDTHNVTTFNSIFPQSSDYITELNLSNWDMSNWNIASHQAGDDVVLKIDGDIIWNMLGNGSPKKLILDNAVLHELGYRAFYNLDNVEELSLKNVDSSRITSMNYMFYDMKKLKSIDLTGFDTSNVTDMSYAFHRCEVLESIDVSSFDTSKVIDMRAMFAYCNKLTSLDITNFDTRNVTDFSAMIECSNLEELNMSNLRFDSYTNSSGIMSNMIGGGTTQKLRKIIADNVVLPPNSYYAFGGLEGLEEVSLRNIDTTKSTTMSGMFDGDKKLTTLDLSSFNTRKVTDMENMFKGTTLLKTIYVSDKFVTNKVNSSDNMFNGCESLVGGAGTVYDASHIDKLYARVDTSTNPGYFTLKTNIGNLGNSLVNTANNVFKN